MDCTYLLSCLAYEDSKVSENEKALINDMLGIEISDLTIQTFARSNSNFDIESVCRTVEAVCATDDLDWTKFGSGKEQTAKSIVSFFEDIGELILKADNPQSQLEKLYHFIAVQNDYINGDLADIKLPGRNRFMSDISRDFFGGKAEDVNNIVSNQKSAEEAQAKALAADAAVVQPDMEDPMEELNKLIGLTDIKKDVADLINLVKIQKLREERGMKTVPVSKHLVFTGNPGTGKTTVARILAQLYKQIGVLETGQLVETDRSGLVAGYVGQTAIKTQEMINKAMGGVLFIDEAYSLAKEGNDFGQEAIATILKAMEDNRDKFVVIVAGYDDLMDNFINSNPGLKSRFSKYFHFPDYTAEEMLGIFKMNCKKYQYELSPEAEEKVKEYLIELEENKDENFANARDVRNYFERVITNQANRIAEMSELKDEDVALILPEDLSAEESEEEPEEE
ncbi:MAG: AAA family ATPase [Firmicutes bacterium]|nr:AAA family ATPase [Bacillota bacterium]